MPDDRKTPAKNSVSRIPSTSPAEEVASANEVVSGQAAPPIIASEALLAGRTEVQIRHRGEIYRLTLTRAGKLILHK